MRGGKKWTTIFGGNYPTPCPHWSNKASASSSVGDSMTATGLPQAVQRYQWVEPSPPMPYSALQQGVEYSDMARV